MYNLVILCYSKNLNRQIPRNTKAIYQSTGFFFFTQWMKKVSVKIAQE